MVAIAIMSVTAALGLAGALTGEAVATILGGLVGYVVAEPIGAGLAQVGQPRWRSGRCRLTFGGVAGRGAYQSFALPVPNTVMPRQLTCADSQILSAQGR